MKRDTLAKVLVIAALLLVTAGVARSSSNTSQANESEPRVTAFYRGTSGGLRLVLFYPTQKKLYMYKDDGTCDNSWTIGATGAPLTEDKCR